LLDIDLIAPSLGLLRLRPPVDIATVRAAPATVKVTPTPLLILVHRFSAF